MALEPEESRYEGIHCNLVVQKFPPAVIVLKISGSDIGEFGEAPMRELAERISRPVYFFIDAREVRGVSIDVSGDWAHWLSTHRSQLRSITMLTGSHFIQLTAEFVRRFADLQGIMRICTEPGVFDQALTEALAAQQQ